MTLQRIRLRLTTEPIGLIILTSTTQRAHRGHTSYQLADGTAIDSQQVQIMALASEFPQGERENDVFTIKLSSITEIH
jgi:hypothetical protein